MLATNAFSVLQSVPWAAFSALRAYVLSRSRLLGLLILVLASAPTAINTVRQLLLFQSHKSWQNNMLHRSRTHFTSLAYMSRHLDASRKIARLRRFS
ncbi:hypothetical protein L227DRAFT_330350 [Lentinus tigrinus ALCF2SS1-6]|uniref:Uncharacterized protein n=1 Tax=Lentinus tigrinus ALCF2SS1-6 TaxID=1328759 RepID=A0A5C2SN11_9APHY|nr:hypothetical protein L227DRAFT_330350 [Lentinus tigrinus ALCF2SS1-6]